MPINPATAGAKSGVSTTAARTPISIDEIARPKTATTSGSPAATTDPNATRRMTAASSSPRPSGVPPSSALEMVLPPSSTWRPCPRVSSASLISSLPLSAGTFQLRVVSWISATAVFPSGEVRTPAGRPTPSRRSAFAKNASMRSRTAGLRAPASLFHTVVTVSPLRPPKRCSRSCEAWADCDPLVLKSALNSPASSGLIPTTAIRRPTHARTTRPRRRATTAARRARDELDMAVMLRPRHVSVVGREAGRALRRPAYDEARLVREDDELRAVAGAELDHRPRDVGARRGRRDDEALGDLLVGHAAADERHDLALAVGQLLDERVLGGRRRGLRRERRDDAPRDARR